MCVCVFAGRGRGGGWAGGRAWVTPYTVLKCFRDVEGHTSPPSHFSLISLSLALPNHSIHYKEERGNVSEKSAPLDDGRHGG